MKVHQHSYGPVTVTIKEGTLVDGLGARVWAVAHSLCRYIFASDTQNWKQIITLHLS